MSWTKSQVKEFARQLRGHVGGAWSWITPKLQDALIAEKAFTVCRLQAAESVRVDDMNQLLSDIRREMSQ